MISCQLVIRFYLVKEKNWGLLEWLGISYQILTIKRLHTFEI